ncbi:MAG: hypothetical protein WCC94_12710 [Candidatus Bathyarchaeia archaeon]
MTDFSDFFHMPLMVRCKNLKCGDVHRSMIQMDEKTFKSPGTVLENNSEQCPKCGKMSTYSKKDYFFRP